MGRSLNLYAIPSTIVHDSSKRICMNWEYERSCDEAKEELHSHLNKDKTYENYRDQLADVAKTWSSNKSRGWDAKYKAVYNQDWCPWCEVFSGEGLYDSQIVKARMDVHHSYSSPIWMSDWHFYKMYPGKSHSDIINRFRNDRMYREITQSDVNDVKMSLERLGKAYCTADREALDETGRFVRFCESCLKEPDTIVIYESEF